MLSITLVERTSRAHDIRADSEFVTVAPRVSNLSSPHDFLEKPVNASLPECDLDIDGRPDSIAPVNYAGEIVEQVGGSVMQGWINPAVR